MAKTSSSPSSGAKLLTVLWKASRSVEVFAFSQICTLGLSPTDFAVLEVILHKGPQPVNVIGSKVLLTSGSMTAAVDKLEQQGLVERQSDPQDRRARLVALTPAGRIRIETAYQRHATALDEAISVLLTPTEQRKLETLLKKLGKGLSKPTS